LTIVPFAAFITAFIAKFVKESKGNKDSIVMQENEPSNKRRSLSIDIKGILALSATVSSFLIGLTLIQIGLSPQNIPEVATAFAASAISLAIFVSFERKIRPPFLDLRLLKNRILLPSFILLISTGITMFMIYPTIVQLVRSPIPLGFGHGAVDAANVQLPFMVMFLVFASVTPFIINRIGNVKPTIIGSIVSLIGGISLLMFHSTEFTVSSSLAIIASGLSLTITATWNMVVSSSPKEFTGISVGVGALLLFIGMAIGPALAGVYMADHKTIQNIEGSYPSPGSYNLVFGTALLLAAVSLGFALVLRRGVRRKEVEP
jgi:hypothetical protein